MDVVKIKVPEMRAHVEGIIAKSGVVYRPIDDFWKSRCLPWSNGEKPIVEFVPVRSEMTYAIAMHELGHVFGWQQNDPNEFVREKGAWTWALFHAIVWTPSMEKFAAASLRRAARRFG
jgi:hypothetical protein